MGATSPWGAAVPAEWWERLAARLIEALVFGVFYYILFIALWSIFRTVGMMEDVQGRLPGLFAWFLAGLAYALYDWRAHSRDGRTFGKRIMRIHLVPQEPGGTAALLKRSLLYPGTAMVMGIPVVNLLAGMLVFGGGLLILMDKPLQRGPHDRLAGTLVVKDLR
ncbi:RDD family protein [Nonomuraea sp. NN258]|uniref:RDD family protein n=1 Tax=Nonomuraea antri TaxID=2730852 RepID=UPI0015698667|nr:RDD family protein [Nonomuraea antri]NRQ36087.1 RDD family protein [Nonomuraea antri]